MSLPLPRHSGEPYRIAVVCLGNICRSPVGQVVLAAKLDDAGLTGRIETRSSGTGDWHVGDPMDERAATSLRGAGYDPSAHRAVQFDSSWFDEFDLILAMDSSNYRTITALAPGDADAGRVRMFREFDPRRDPASADDIDVPDPWYGGPDDYALVLTIVERTTDELVAQLHTLL